MMLNRGLRLACVLLLFSVSAGMGQTQTGGSESQILARVAEFHGAAGVFAVAGYRIGVRALAELDEQRGSFNLDVTHHTPFEVQWSCIADGVQAATGVSAGKLNLHIVEARRDQLETVVWDKHSRRHLYFNLQPSFLTKYLDTPKERQASAAREVLNLPDDAIFTMRETEKEQ